MKETAKSGGLLLLPWANVDCFANTFTFSFPSNISKRKATEPNKKSRLLLHKRPKSREETPKVGNGIATALQ
jgi:hypothetical protein